MKKLSLVLFSLSLFIFLNGVSASQKVSRDVGELFDIGSGNAADTYQISTCKQLQNMSQDVTASYQLTDNVDCSDTKNWNGGTGFIPISGFNGILNGNNHVIANLYINNTKSGSNAALFSSTGNTAIIQNLKLADVDNSGISTAALVGTSQTSQISNVHVTGKVTATTGQAGGLVVSNRGGKITNSSFVGIVNTNGAFVGGLAATNAYPGEITNSYANADINGGISVGGLVFSNKGVINNSYATGTINGGISVGGLVSGNYGVINNSYSTRTIKGGTYVGGLVSTNYGVINNSYATGVINNGTYVGGLVGTNSGITAVCTTASCGMIANSYATSVVNGNAYLGGLVGTTHNGTIQYSYSAGQVNGKSPMYTGGLIGTTDKDTVITNSYYDLNTSGQHDAGKGIPKTTKEMMQQKTFTGWDFTNTWEIVDGHDYPRLKRQQVELEISFAPIPSPQKVSTPFQIKVFASDNNFNGRVYLYSALGKVDPDYVDLVNGQWIGNITLFEIGKNNYLELHWSNENSGGNNRSNKFDTTNQKGDITQDANLAGRITTDNNKPIPEVKVQLLDGDPKQKGKVVYSTSTDGNGDYNFINITPGVYWLTTQKSGYQNTAQEIEVVSKRIITNDIVLYPTCDTKGKVPVLLIPGIMGSYSKDKSYGIRPYPRLSPIAPAWDSGELKLLDPAWKVGWNTVSGALQKLDYTRGCTIFDVPYYWTLPIPEIRDQYLMPWINRAKQLSGSDKVDIIAHSMGGLVTRSYAQSAFYNNDIRKFAIVGTPNEGADSVYYIWEGGDPIEADKVSGDNNNWISPNYFYTNTLDYYYSDSHAGEHVCKFNSIYRYIPKECDKEKIYDLMHDQGTSSGQLIPIYKYALLDYKLDTDTPIIKEENTLLKALNELHCLNPKGCVDRNGNLYYFSDPQYIFYSNNTTGIGTKLFIGTDQPTVSSIYVKPQSSSYKGKTYKDGIPIDVTKDSGDGTVLIKSVFFDDNFKHKLNFTEKEEEHGFLINAFTPELVSFITGASHAPIESQAPQDILAIGIDGRIQPHTISIKDFEGNYMKPQNVTEEDEYQIDSSVLEFIDPASGKYNIALDSPYKEDYELSLYYYDSHTDELFEQRYPGYFDDSLRNFSFTLNNKTSANETIVFDRTFDTPTDLTLNDISDKIQLVWQDKFGDKNKDVDHYEIYWKSDTEPYMQLLCKTQQKIYLTDHDWEDATTNVYAVRSVLKNGSSTFLSQLAFFIPEESMITNRLSRP